MGRSFRERTGVGSLRSPDEAGVIASCRRTGSARPLLPVGFHRADLGRLRGLCVDYFPDSRTRPILMATLAKIVEVVNKSSIRGALWVDGGLLTEAKNPIDFEVTFVLTDDVYRSLTPTQREIFDWFRRTSLFEQHSCHNYGVVIDAAREDGEIMQRFWLRRYGFGDEEKGRGVVEIVVPSLTP